ncbi:sugar ABC transporter substrate-binding protein [Nocardioides sp. HDW12B]|uniref:sugar ABC transporter substrate-binding protein n=1 Tax=Nocardioides sp. HDW12B TaxID=2714939 RepID=UPI00140A6873|nr:sugar ABC transporter substrate-binding protein [Nocardioides sp. HDW12B]QIK66781.1 sugar ABC transporter substrate-binding protein [Nocardioides sp. HDW12B]
MAAGGLIASELLAACGGSSSPGSGELDPDALDPFEPSGSRDGGTGLPERLAWAPTADSEFFLAFGQGMRLAATERGFDYVTATSGNDPRLHVDQMNGFLDQGVGALAMQPLSPDADAVVLQRAIDRGVCTQGIITAPSTMQVVASQYQIGYDQGKAAADYCVAELGGNAQVLYFNLDSASPQLRLRHDGVLDGLKTGGGGIEVVGDITVAEISTTSGFNTMTSALQRYSDIKVVLGGDTIVVGAHKALAEQGKLTDDMFLSGVDGDREALALIKQGGAYKLSIAFAWKLMGFGLGQFGADWVEGREVPQLVVARGVQLDSADAVEQFEAAGQDPSAVFGDRARYEEYLPLYGTVSYESRQQYWTAPVDPPSA